MKKLFTLLALAGFSAATASPLPLGLANGHQVATPKVASTTIESFYNNVVANTVDKSNSTQATFKTIVPNVAIGPVYSYFNEGSQFSYDPENNLLSILNLNYKTTGNSITGSTINILTSTNLGTSWATNSLYNSDGPFAIYNSFAIVNPKKSTLFTDMNIMSTGMNLRFVNGSGVINGNFFVIKNGTTTDTASFNEISTNNPLKYSYPLPANMMPYKKDGKTYAIGSGRSYRPSTAQSTDDGAKYTFFAFNFEDGDFTTSVFPSSMQGSNYASPVAGANATDYLAIENMDYDSDGNIYYGAVNYMPDDNTLAVPAITKSTDLGKTWSNLSAMTMPTSIFSEYSKSRFKDLPNAQIGSRVIGHYELNGFAVYGNNKFSYLLRLLSSASIDANTSSAVLDLVEVTFDNGTWAIKQVTELADYIRVLENTFSGDFRGRTKSSVSTIGHEVQLAKTADGKYLVAKWIDVDTLKGVDGNFTFVANNNQNVEQLFTFTRLNPTDVFIAYKDLTTGQWSNKLNVTNDLTFQKATKIPSIVPSIDNIPLIYLEPSFTTLATADSAISKAPTWVRGMFADQGYSHPQKLQFAIVGPSSSVKDENPTTTGQFQLNPVFPNPATGVSEITFSMNKPGMAKLALINQVGQVVKVIYEGQLSEGLKAVTVNTDELAAGVYYYTLTVGDNSATKVLNVVK